MAYIYVMHPDNRIREFRKRARLSQDELGRRIGMHQTHVGNIENGTRPLTLDWARRIAKEFGVTVADLLTREDHPLRLEEDERQLIETYRAASEEQKETIRRVTEAVLPFTHQKSTKAA